MTELSGTIEKVIFHNKKNGFTVANFTTSDDNVEIETIITGTLMDPKKGQYLNIKGNWIQHAVYGEQFQVESFSTVLPKTTDALEQYLLSGSIKGVSKKLAKDIIEACGDNFFEILEKNPSELLKIKGLGKKTLEKLIDSFREQNENVNILAELQEYNISAKLARRIFDVYGDDTVKIVLNDPYDLALNVQGIGFLKADEIAQKVGFDNNNLKRNVAGIIYTLMDCYRSGHTYLEEEQLVQKAQKLLNVSEEDIRQELSEAIFSGKVYQEQLDDKTIFYPSELYRAESNAAYSLTRLAANANELQTVSNFDKTILEIEDSLGFHFDLIQKEAIKTVTKSPITVITGGPGTGKSATRLIVK